MAEQPLLFIDVDGVLSTFGFATGEDDPRNLHVVDGILHHIPREMAERLLSVLPHFEPVWATGWGDRANDHLVFILGMPGELEVVEFEVAPSTDGSGHWKLEALTERAGTRAAAWIDDGHNDACIEWAHTREAPTLLVSTDPHVGLTDEHVDELVSWAGSINAL